MDLETVFSITNTLAMAGWILLALLPRWRWSARIVVPVILPLLGAVAYGVLLLPRFADADGSYGSLAGVAQLFEVPELLLAGWIHYLAFDLFVGAWQVRDAQERGIPHLLVVPALLLTFLFGPIGLAAYLVVRALRTERGLALG